MLVLYQSCPNKLLLLKEAAQLLGFDTHGSYILKVRMAKSVPNVLQFLNDLREKLKPYSLKEKAQLLGLKEEEKKAAGQPFDGKLNSWDFRYYHRLLLEKEYEVDDEVIKNYFPIELVTKNLLGTISSITSLRSLIGCRSTPPPPNNEKTTEVYQLILGLHFEEVKDAKVWHEDVRLFAVYNASDKELVGHFWLDLYPREGNSY